jgi:tetratricopeptide (TPR) repeat protein
MAACAISAFGQQTSSDLLDRARAMADDARKQAAAAKDQVKVQMDAQVQAAVKAAKDWASSDARWDFQDFSDQIAQMDMQRWKFDNDALAMELAQAAPIPPMAPMPPMPAMGKIYSLSYGGGAYESGKSQLNLHHYEKAVEAFDRVINSKDPSPRADGAYYWKAYALNRLGKRDEALAALDELQKKFPQSGWLNDAKALRAEVQAAKGQPVSPDAEADEDLKLYAINALMGSDADRAVPLLEGLLNNPKMSPRLKERALFVLAQNGSEKGRDIVTRYAKGGSNPDLQITALEYLGTFRSKESRQVLADAYASSHDVNVKRAVLRGFERSHDIEHLAAAAKSEQDVELRAEAVRGLGVIRDDQAIASLVSLYGSESQKDIKREIIHSLANDGAAKQLIECARKESDPELKRTAVQRLGQMKTKEALDYIAELLK